MAERGGLENRRPFTGSGGSNPSLSVTPVSWSASGFMKGLQGVEIKVAGGRTGEYIVRVRA